MSGLEIVLLIACVLNLTALAYAISSLHLDQKLRVDALDQVRDERLKLANEAVLLAQKHNEIAVHWKKLSDTVAEMQNTITAVKANQINGVRR